MPKRLRKLIGTCVIIAFVVVYGPVAMALAESRIMEAPQFYTIDQVADALSTTKAQVYALVRRKELRAIKLGGRGQWRIGRADLDAFLQHAYVQTSDWIDEHPFADGAGGDED